MREPHIIKRAAGGRTPFSVAVVYLDTFRDALPGPGGLKLLTWGSGCLIYLALDKDRIKKRQVVRFSNVDQFWAALEVRIQSKPATTLVTWQAKDVAAQLGLWGLCESGYCTLEGDDPYSNADGKAAEKQHWNGYAVLENPPTIVSFRIPSVRAKLMLVGLENYGIDNLEELKDQPLVKGCGDRGQLRDHYAASDKAYQYATWIENAFMAYVSLVNTADFGSVQTTAASQAMHAYRHRFMEQDIHVHDNEEVIALERESLYGGRCECRYLGHVFSDEPPLWRKELRGDWVRTINAKGQIYRLDVNSLYPSVARLASVPCRLAEVYHRPEPIQLCNLNNEKACIARVLVRTEIPIVPVRLEKKCGIVGGAVVNYQVDGMAWIDPSVIYPVGTFWTTLCGPELSRAFAYGEILKCDMVATYHTERLFLSWVDNMYELIRNYRTAGHKAMAKVAKRMTLALFGKFGQRSKRWLDMPSDLASDPYSQWFEIDPETRMPCQWRTFAWQVQRLVNAGESWDSFPAITAWVHSLGRMRLWQAIQAAGEANVYYYDTDSIWCNTEGYGRLDAYGWLGETELGLLKQEGKYDHVTFYGIKNYRTDSRAIQEGDIQSEGPLSSESISYHKSRPLSSDLLKYQSPQPVLQLQHIRRHDAYRHGDVMPDGSVKPLSILDPEEYPAR